MSVKLNKPMNLSWKMLIGACLLTATVTMCLMKWTNEKTMKIEEPKTNKWKIAFILTSTIWIAHKIAKIIKWMTKRMRILSEIIYSHMELHHQRPQPRANGTPRDRARSAMGLTD